MEDKKINSSPENNSAAAGESEEVSLDKIDGLGGSCFKKLKEKLSSALNSPTHKISDDRYYHMGHSKRGKAVIFNHKNFEMKDLEPRFGTDVDKERLISCFKCLKFDVEAHDDLSKVDILIKLKNLRKEDHRERDCLAVIVLSHGNQEQVFARDDYYRPEELWNPFTADKCPSLAGKPKLFFIQVCRGNAIENITSAQPMETLIDSRPFSSGHFYYTVPNWADFLITFSPPQGFDSWKSPHEGSWFVDALVSVLRSKCAQYDVQKMMTLVTQKVARSYKENQPDFLMKHVPMTSSTLTRILYFPTGNAE